MKNSYLRNVPSTEIDVYDVLVAFNVTCPARAHAIKKLLCSGIRGGGKDEVRDLREAIQAMERAVEIANNARVRAVMEGSVAFDPTVS